MANPRRPFPGVAVIVLCLGSSCASDPVLLRRSLTLAGSGEQALTLVFAGLHGHAAGPLLRVHADAACERRGAAVEHTTLLSATEETLPPKEPEGPPTSITTISGTLTCGGSR